MRLIDTHKRVKDDNADCVVIIKYGNFYIVFDEDTSFI